MSPAVWICSRQSISINAPGAADVNEWRASVARCPPDRALPG